ncbi:hypothetical protein QA584_07080 [Anaerocolumna sp. AGMB13025]|uniref:hypothetical protein n=1 Tax=Anaerocolumna sp. AGMB13025 TaxID=3039116 RepID=UPI00241DCC71|nr:hypothetical protein [Anaerocolumna sp. AGMB13025]WFR58835.1 hypothetical protein QA584_07080 [Anaerocolumna sp. AGMB13025]
MSRLLNDMLFLAGTGEHSWTLTEEVVIVSLLKDVYDSFQEIAAEKKLVFKLPRPFPLREWSRFLYALFFSHYRSAFLVPI